MMFYVFYFFFSHIWLWLGPPTEAFILSNLNVFPVTKIRKCIDFISCWSNKRKTWEINLLVGEILFEVKEHSFVYQSVLHS